MKILNIGVFVFCFSGLIAQDIDPTEVTVVEGFKSEIPESEKIKETTQFTDTTVVNKNQTYSFIDKTLDANYESRPIKAAKVSGEKQSDLFRSTIMLGGGFPLTSLSSVSVNSLRKDNYSYGLTFNHFANRYKVSYVDLINIDNIFKNSVNKTNIFGKKIGEKNIFIANLDYDRRTVNHDIDFSGPSECTDCNKNRFSYSKLSLDMVSRELSEFKWKHQTKFFVSDLNELSENQIHFSTNLNKTINGLPFTLEVELNDYINYANTDSTTSRKKEDVKSLHVFPSVSITKFGIDMDLGLELHYQTDLLGSTMKEVFPQIKLSKHLVKNILYVEAGLRHKEQRHTLKSLSDENPYIHSFGTNQSWDLDSFSMDLRNSNIDEVYVSMRNVLGKDEVFIGSVAYGHIENMQSFVLLSYSNLLDRFISNYEDVCRLSVAANYDWQINDLIGVNAAANFYNYYTLVSNKENINGNLGISLNLDEKIKVNTSLSYLGKRTSFVQSVLDFDGVIAASPFESVDLNPQLHLNLSIGYNYTKSISAFFRINNILNSKEDVWQSYREIGRNAQLGFSYSF
nr:putative TonB-dependent receptor [uncultured bacterium]